VQQARLDPKARKAMSGQLDRPEPKAKQVLRVRLELRVPPGLSGLQVPRGIKDFKESPEPRVRRAHKATSVQRVRPARRAKQELPEPQALPVPRVRPVPRERKATQARRDRREPPGLKAHRAFRAFKVMPGRQEPPDPQEP
jgi:hypothetical protein